MCYNVVIKRIDFDILANSLGIGTFFSLDKLICIFLEAFMGDSVRGERPIYTGQSLIDKTRVEFEVMKERGKISELKEHLGGIDQKMKALTKLMRSSDNLSKNQLTKDIKVLKEDIKKIKKAIRQENKLTFSKEFRNKFSFLKKVNTGEVPLLRLNQLKTRLISADSTINAILDKYLLVASTSSSALKTSQTGLKLLGQHKDVHYYLNHFKVAELIKAELGLDQRHISNAKDMLSYMEGLKNKKEAIDQAVKQLSNLKKGNEFYTTTLTGALEALKNKNQWLSQEMKACEEKLGSKEVVTVNPQSVQSEGKKEFSLAYAELVETERQFNEHMKLTSQLLREVSKYVDPKEKQLLTGYAGLLNEMVNMSDSILKETNQTDFFEMVTTFKGELRDQKSESLAGKSDAQSRTSQVNALARAFSGEQVVKLMKPMGNWANEYINIQGHLKLINEVIKNQKDNKEFLKDVRNNPLIQQGLNGNIYVVSNLLIEPIQRPLKYPTLFGVFIKNSSEGLTQPLKVIEENIGIGASLMNLSKTFKESENLYKFI